MAAILAWTALLPLFWLALLVFISHSRSERFILPSMLSMCPYKMFCVLYSVRVINYCVLWKDVIFGYIQHLLGINTFARYANGSLHRIHRFNIVLILLHFTRRSLGPPIGSVWNINDFLFGTYFKCQKFYIIPKFMINDR